MASEPVRDADHVAPKRTCRACFFDSLDDHTCGYKGVQATTGCSINLFSSRVCKIGTKGCVKPHNDGGADRG